MAKKLINDESLTSIADSIREKTGSTEKLIFPEGFVSAISGIEAGSGGGDDLFKEFIETGISEVSSNTVTEVRKKAFADMSIIKTVDLPNCESIGEMAFYYCSNLSSVNLPNCTYIWAAAFSQCQSLTYINIPAAIMVGPSAFYRCSYLPSIDVPKASVIYTGAFSYCYRLSYINAPIAYLIQSGAFYSCSALASIDLPACSSIQASAFNGCKSLSAIKLGYSSVCTLSSTNAFLNTPMSISTLTGTFGSIYVPASLVDAYKAAANWSIYADRITAIVD